MRLTNAVHFLFIFYQTNHKHDVFQIALMMVIEMWCLNVTLFLPWLFVKGRPVVNATCLKFLAKGGQPRISLLLVTASCICLLRFFKNMHFFIHSQTRRNNSFLPEICCFSDFEALVLGKDQFLMDIWTVTLISLWKDANFVLILPSAGSWLFLP